MHETSGTSGLLDGVLEAVSRCFTPETAQALINLPPDERVRSRLEERGARASAERLTPAEADEYDTLIDAGDIVATL